MAKLDNKEAPGFLEFKAGMDWSEYHEHNEKVMQRYQDVSNSLAPGKIVGGIVQFPACDGYAVYLVSRVRPLTLQHVPYLDAWEIPYAHMKGLDRGDISENLERQRGLRELFQRQCDANS